MAAPGLLALAMTATVATGTVATGSVAEEAVLDEKVRTSSDREDALFGDDEPDEPGAFPLQGVGTAGREAELFGGDRAPREGVIDELESMLEDTEDFLDLGGTLWLWLEYNALESGEPADFRLRSPSFLDMYADVRPVDSLRGYVQGRLRHDFTVGDDTVDPFTMMPVQRTQIVLDQYWLKLDIEKKLFVTAGKQRIRWGASRVWQPTDFINQQRLDPTNLFDQRLGVALVKAHLPVESLGWNFYAIANLEGADSPADVGGALRAEIVFGPAELTLSGAVRKVDAAPDPTIPCYGRSDDINPKTQEFLGADISFGLWLFEVRVEAALAHGITRPYFEGDPDYSDGVQLVDCQAIERIDRSNDWVPQIVTGFDITVPYSDQDNITFGAEYFFNDFGIDNADLYPFLFLEGAFQPFYTGKHYAALFVLLLGPGTWDDTSIFLTGIGNLSDRSFLVRLQYSVTVYRYLSLQIFGNVHFGNLGELHLGYDIPRGGSLPGFEDGFEIAAPLIDVGIALVVDL